jgi:hypothetical protein
VQDSAVSCFLVKKEVASMALNRAAYIVIAPFLATLIASPPAIALKRIASIPELLWGTWAPNADACNDPDKLAVVLSAKSYKSSQASCDLVEISETPGPNGPTYSARSQCTSRGQTQPTVSILIFRPEDSNRISIGPDFESLKVHQKCSASQPVTR